MFAEFQTWMAGMGSKVPTLGVSSTIVNRSVTEVAQKQLDQSVFTAFILLKPLSASAEDARRL